MDNHYHLCLRTLEGTRSRVMRHLDGLYTQRFNRTYRHEVLDAYVFESLEQVRELSAQGMREYNEERPHDTLAGVPPATFRARVTTAGTSPLKLSPRRGSLQQPRLGEKL